MKTLLNTLITLTAFMSCLIWLAFAWDIAMHLMLPGWESVIEISKQADHDWLTVSIAILVSGISLLIAVMSYKWTPKE